MGTKILKAGGSSGPLCTSLCRNNEGKEAVMAESVSNKGKFIQCFPEEPERSLVLKQKHYVPACGLPLSDTGGCRDSTPEARARGDAAPRPVESPSPGQAPALSSVSPLLLGFARPPHNRSPAPLTPTASPRSRRNNLSECTFISVTPPLQHPPQLPVLFTVKSCITPCPGSRPRRSCCLSGLRVGPRAWAPGPLLPGAVLVHGSLLALAPRGSGHLPTSPSRWWCWEQIC